MENFDIKLKLDDRFFIGYLHNTHTKPSTNTTIFQSHRIIRITNGEAIWRVEAQEFLLRKGDLILFNNVEERRISEIIQSPFEYDVIDLPMPIHGFVKLFYGKNKKYTATPLINGYIDDLIHEMKSPSDDPHAGMCAKYLLNLVLLHICRLSGGADDREGNSRPNTAVINAILYIHENFSENISVSELAKKHGYGLAHFGRIFKKVTGSSVKKYLLSVRMENILPLLREDNSNILDIAIQCGFSSPSGFYKAFSKYSNTTPRTFRR